jgi:hypothetical protein
MYPKAALRLYIPARVVPDVNINSASKIIQIYTPTLNQVERITLELSRRFVKNNLIQARSNSFQGNFDLIVISQPERRLPAHTDTLGTNKHVSAELHYRGNGRNRNPNLRSSEYEITRQQGSTLGQE